MINNLANCIFFDIESYHCLFWNRSTRSYATCTLSKPIKTSQNLSEASQIFCISVALCSCLSFDTPKFLICVLGACSNATLSYSLTLSPPQILHIRKTCALAFSCIRSFICRKLLTRQLRKSDMYHEKHNSHSTQRKMQGNFPMQSSNTCN